MTAQATPETQNACRHCGSPAPAGHDFCCSGCEGAYALLHGEGLEAYYERRCLDPSVKALIPDDAEGGPVDFSGLAKQGEDGVSTLHLMVEGVHCAACVWLIEALLSRQEGVTKGRVNMTTRRLTLTWKGAPEQAGQIVAPVLAVGYSLMPFDPERLTLETAKQERSLLVAMAVAGFAAGNVMLFSVSVWSGVDMGPHTRDFMHWLSAAVAIPAVIFCVRPFARSAISALRAGRMNMDAPITLAVILTALMSLHETMVSGPHAYFDSAVSLLFFLLIGRYLDSRARGRARSAAEHLLTLSAKSVTVIDPDGSKRVVAPDQAKPGDRVLVAAGERIGVDGAVVDGHSEVDASLITGESLPQPVASGAKVFAGAVNLTGPLHLSVSATGESTLLAEIVRMMEQAEQGRAKYVALADRVARHYAPVVHLLALACFILWFFIIDASWQVSTLNAIAVLIITCPCALGLAVPVVQVIASGRLLRQGILLKSATALERLAEVDTVVFDKTGTLTMGRPELMPAPERDEGALLAASALAQNSKHPLSRAITRAAESLDRVEAVKGVTEVPGEGLVGPDGSRLGRKAWAAPEAVSPSTASGPELWLSRPGQEPVRFVFSDRLRPDAVPVLDWLQREKGLQVEILSGDLTPVVAEVADALSVKTWQAELKPADKVARLEALKAEGRTVLMVGDGLNDAPALASADVSLSPSSAMDVTQTAADAVFQGEKLEPLAETLRVASMSGVLVKQNFGLSFWYNIVTVPLAMAGYVTPLIAAVAMSASSVVVIANALRLARRGKKA